MATNLVAAFKELGVAISATMQQAAADINSTAAAAQAQSTAGITGSGSVGPGHPTSGYNVAQDLLAKIMQANR